jgi:hypothetical protein
MSLEDRFTSFKRAAAPDVWRDAVEREPAVSGAPDVSHRGKQFVAIVTAFALAVGLFAVLTESFSGQHGGGSDVPQGPGPGVGPSRPISVSGTEGAFRCTAQFPSRTITPGAKTGVRVTVTNLSQKVVNVSEGGGNGATATLQERSSGELFQDTIHMHDGIIGGVPMPQPIKPGASYTLPVYDAPLLVPGAIETTVTCPVAGGFTLPPVNLVVQPIGPAPTDQQAIQRAIAAVSPHFDGCAPTRTDQLVTGFPTPRDPTLGEATCKVAIIPQTGFDIVVLGAICPPQVARFFNLASLASEITAVPRIDMSPPWNIAWQTVVVSSRTTVIANGYSVHAGTNSYGTGGGFHPC